MTALPSWSFRRPARIGWRRASAPASSTKWASAKRRRRLARSTAPEPSGSSSWPAAVREVWAGEVRKFSNRERRVVKAKTIHDLGFWLKGRAQGLLVSYEMAVKWAQYLREDVIDALIFDECHYLKNADTARTHALLGAKCDGIGGLVQQAAQSWWLSGTPIPNDPVDIWTFLHCSGHTPLSLGKFTSRYFKSYVGTYSSTHKPREEMVPELQQILRVASLRRTMNDVGLQLPPVFLTTTEVDGDTAEIRDLLRTYPGLESAILDAIEKGGLSFLDSMHIATLRRLVGESKAPAYGALLVEEFKNGLDQMVVFGFHTKALQIIVDCLTAAGIPCGLLDGKTSEAKRVALVKDFQAKKVKCAVLNYKAGGTGITLTASAHLDMFESSWSPADNAQAIKRISRDRPDAQLPRPVHFPCKFHRSTRDGARSRENFCYCSHRRLLTGCYRRA